MTHAAERNAIQRPAGHRAALESQGPFRPAGPLPRTHAIPPPSDEDGGNFYLKERMSFQKIIALDLAKFKTVGCVMGASSRDRRANTLSLAGRGIHRCGYAAAVSDEGVAIT